MGVVISGCIELIHREDITATEYTSCVRIDPPRLVTLLAVNMVKITLADVSK